MISVEQGVASAETADQCGLIRCSTGTTRQAGVSRATRGQAAKRGGGGPTRAASISSCPLDFADLGVRDSWNTSDWVVDDAQITHLLLSKSVVVGVEQDWPADAIKGGHLELFEKGRTRQFLLHRTVGGSVKAKHQQRSRRSELTRCS